MKLRRLGIITPPRSQHQRPHSQRHLSKTAAPGYAKIWRTTFDAIYRKGS
jgi:hypothetical protein